MSHFFTVVLVRPDTTDIEKAVTELLAPYEETESNEQSRWDWWGFGGRWTGALIWERQLGADNPAPSETYTLNGNMRPVTELPESFTCYAIVTPDGSWHERGEMGWWGMVTDEKPEDVWLAEMRRLLVEYNDCLAVACDLHI